MKFFLSFYLLIKNGAKIIGENNITLASDKIKTYNGSLISTAKDLTGGGKSVGQVKIYTTDGVNFNYSNKGAIKEVNNLNSSNSSLSLNLNGTITSGDIVVKNASQGELNLDGANLQIYKATKMSKHVNGNITLDADNKVVVDQSTIKANVANAYDSDMTGNINIKAAKGIE